MRSWLDDVATCTDVYVYQAALMCADCCQSIALELLKKNVEDDGDSGTFLQGPTGASPHSDGGGEADSAQFCDCGRACVNAVEVVPGHKIGCPLGNPLTTDGAEAVRESIRRMILDPTKLGRRMGRLLCKVWHDYTETPLLRVLPAHVGSKALHDALAHIHKQEKCEVQPVMFTDLEHIYGIAASPQKTTGGGSKTPGSKTLAWRITATDEGGFTDLGVLKMPNYTTSRTAEELVAEAIAQDDWY